MCGITGAVWFDAAAALGGDTLERMTDVLRHRGPDDQGSYRSELQFTPGYGAMPGRIAGREATSHRMSLCGADQTTKPRLSR